jgi:hypothetical protein
VPGWKAGCRSVTGAGFAQANTVTAERNRFEWLVIRLSMVSANVRTSLAEKCKSITQGRPPLLKFILRFLSNLDSSL